MRAPTYKENRREGREVDQVVQLHKSHRRYFNDT